MSRTSKIDLRDRVLRACESALADHQSVTPIDVLVGMNLLASSNVEAWKRGRLEFLADLIQAGPDKFRTSMRVFLDWALDKGLTKSEVRYTRPTRDGEADLKVSREPDP